jgi:hypothetical protein
MVLTMGSTSLYSLNNAVWRARFPAAWCSRFTPAPEQTYSGTWDDRQPAGHHLVTARSSPASLKARVEAQFIAEILTITR